MAKILENISVLAEKEGITIGALEKKIGASKGVLSRAIANGTDIQAKWIQAIVENYPHFSAEWLLTGNGEMIKGGTLPVAHQTENPKEGIPLIPFSAMAGALTGEQSALEYECERYVVPAFSGAVPMSGLFFQWNKPYVLDTAQGAIIKRIKPGSDKLYVLIVSDNKEYDPFELPYEDIYAVALVIGIIRLE